MSVRSITEERNDPNLGNIWVNTALYPTVISSSDGWVSLLEVDAAETESDSTLINPWYVKYYIDPIYNEDHLMDVKAQYSSDTTNWTTLHNWGFTVHNGMTGRFQYRFGAIHPVPEYFRVIGRIYPNGDGTTSDSTRYVSIGFGYENFKG